MSKSFGSWFLHGTEILNIYAQNRTEPDAALETTSRGMAQSKQHAERALVYEENFETMPGVTKRRLSRDRLK
jgi:hypothetical protein